MANANRIESNRVLVHVSFLRGPAFATKNTDGRNLCSYNTRSNRTRVIKTPGGDLRVLHIKKRGTAPKCGDCGSKLPGVSCGP